MFEDCLYFNLNALTRRVNHIWQESYGRLNLTPSQAYLLRVVLHQPGISQSEIGAELKLEKSTVTRLIPKLEEKGFIERIIPEQRKNRELQVYPSDRAKSMSGELESIGESLRALMVETIGLEPFESTLEKVKKMEVILDME